MKKTFKTLAFISALALSMTACSTAPAITEPEEEVVVTTVKTTIPEETTTTAVTIPEELRVQIKYTEDGRKNELHYRADGSPECCISYGTDDKIEMRLDMSEDGKTAYTTFYRKDGSIEKKILTTTEEDLRVIEQTIYEEDGSYSFFEYYEDETKKTMYKYDSDGKLVSKYDYGEDGMPTKAIELESDGVSYTNHEFLYNEDGSGNIISKHSDGSRDEEEFKSNLDKTAVRSYDSDGNLTETFIYDYDKNGNKVRTSCYAPDGTLSYFWIKQYDKNGNRIKETKYSPDGTIIG